MGKGDLEAEVWWGNCGGKGNGRPSGLGSGEWSDLNFTMRIFCMVQEVCVGLCKQVTTEMTFFSVDVIFFCRINDTKDFF